MICTIVHIVKRRFFQGNRHGAGVFLGVFQKIENQKPLNNASFIEPSASRGDATRSPLFKAGENFVASDSA
jgi:hypothetical protein